MMPLTISQPNLKAFEAVKMKLLELIVGNFLKNWHFPGFFADISKCSYDFLTNGNVTVKSIT